MLKGCVQLSARPHIDNSVNMVPVDRVASIVVASALMTPIPGVMVVHVDGHPRLHLHEYLGVMEDYGYRVPQVEYSEWRRRLEDYVSDGDDNKPTNALYVFTSQKGWMGGWMDERLAERRALTLLTLLLFFTSRLPLYDFVTADLPANTQAPVLEIRNADTLLRSHDHSQDLTRTNRIGVTRDLVGRYIAYLVAIGFLLAPPPAPAPAPESSPSVNESSPVSLLPKVQLQPGQREAQTKVGGRAHVS